MTNSGSSGGVDTDEETARTIAAREMVRSQQNPDQRHLERESEENGGNNEKDDDERTYTNNYCIAFNLLVTSYVTFGMVMCLALMLITEMFTNRTKFVVMVGNCIVLYQSS